MPSYDHEPRARRPRVLYLIVGLCIVGAAAFLFWPRDKEAPTHVFTQEGFDDKRVEDVDNSQLNHDFGTPAEEASGEPSGTAGSDTPPTGASGTPEPPTYGEVVSGQDAAEAPPAHLRELSSAATTTPEPAATARPQRVGPTGMRTGPAPATAIAEPGPSGAYQVWLGSFRSRDNAQRRVRELSGVGVHAEIVPVDTPNAGQVFRVRVGYFKDVNAARQFGDAIRRQLDEIQYWVDRR